ncbi:MAG TPA: type I polyketide synthase, partial [Longimicrobium sp.]|nr:type I polyketide synthase [Longimicrobium sp.]
FGNAGIMASAGRFQVQLGNDKDHVSTRTAYKLDLKGPAVTVQTTCSTSLVAVCQACQALLTYQCDLALAGGCSIQLPQRSGYMYQEGGISSPDGHCRAFDAQAKGTVGGSGAGVVALKRMEDALRDGDHVYAVIRGFGINNDGSDKVGYTAPSIAGQAGAIRMSLAMAGVEPDTIGYVEAHGTGTPLGDPIEVAALTRAFRAGTERTGFCAIGSVKTNIGHLDSAAGVAGLIKAALTLRNGEIPPSLHFQAPNPAIDFAGSPFYVNATLSLWPRGDTPRRAGVSSFGIGGTNAHVTLEEAPVPVSPPASRAWQLLVLSARTANALEDATDRLAERLARPLDADLADAAWTLQAGRRAFGHRRAVAVPGGDPGEAARRLRARERAADGVAEGAPSVAFLFSGQGAQHVGMGRGLYDTEPVYRAEIDRCAMLLRPHLGLDVRTLLHPGPDAAQDAAGALLQTAMAQPALFVVEYALARLWMSWGVRPGAMTGHSIGEYVAACLAGVFSLEDALALVAARGRLMQQAPPGAMAAVFLGEADLLPLLPDDLSLAVVNGPSVCVVAGPEDAIARFEGAMEARSVGTRRLHTSHAFHSGMMDGALEPFAQVVRGITLRAPTLPLLSNVTGTWMAAEEATDPGYWVRHLRGTVRLADNLAALLQDEGRVLLEVGPGRSLRTVAEQHPARRPGQPVLSSLPHPQDGEEDGPFLLTSLGGLWAAGVPVEWEAFHGGERRLRVPLPTYPFERRRYWVDPDRIALPAISAVRDPAGFLYAPVWEDAPLPAFTPPLPPLRWLVFADAAGLG